MIDEVSEDRTGWARFSDDRIMRYRLSRSLTRRIDPHEGEVEHRVTFVMLNPSTADAFKLDPTVRRCVMFARRWGADMLEIANVFAFRSPHPSVLYAAEDRGEDSRNDAEILAACRGARRVIAAWGCPALGLRERCRRVAVLLTNAGIKLEALALTGVHPRHPLARGRQWIPDHAEPVPWP